MKFHNNEQIKNDIKKVNPDVLVNRGWAESALKSGIVCPNCGSGTGENGTGLTFTQDANGFYRAHCFHCGENFDNLSLIASHFGYNLKQDFPKVIAEGATLIGASADFHDFKHNHKSSAKNFNKRQQEKKPDEPPADYKQFIQVAKNNLINFPSATYRGLMAKTMANFNFGFGVNWKHPNSDKMPPSDRIIIPTSDFHYLARAISDDVKEEFRKIHVGKKEIFNIDDLKPDTTVVVVEGELDCASIWQVSEGLVPCVAVSGCSNYKMILQWLEKNPDCNCSFIVVFDNDSKGDNAGQTNAKKFVDELIQRGFPAVNKLLSDRQDFDANDWLQENPDALQDRIFELYDEGSEELDKVFADLLAEKAFNKKVADFEIANGKIPTGVIGEIKAAIDTLSNLSVDNFNADLLNNSTFVKKLGLCKFYSFAAHALENFLQVFTSKRKFVAPKIRAGVTLDATERAFLNFSESDVNKLIKKSAKSVELQHDEFNKEQKRKEREEFRRQKQAEEEQAKFDGEERLLQLKRMSPSPERNAEMRELIAELCEWQCDRYGNPLFIKPDIENIDKMFDFDPVIENLFGYDLFNRAIVFKKEPFWRIKSHPDYIAPDYSKKKFTDSESYIGESVQIEDKHALANYLSRTYGKFNAYRLFERKFNEFAMANSFHPVKEFLRNLPKWDGVPRAERIFIDFLNADDTTYTREVTFKSLLASIARVYQPGCEWQYMPILRGLQGIGKSYVLKMLGGDWYTELLDSVSDSHALDAIEGSLIVELSELDSFKGVRSNTLKAFVSRSDDKRRKAYAIAKSSNKRTCVFFGTSNDSQLLTDLTGNRRFPIIQCRSEYNQVKYGLTKDYILQLWAELHSKYQKMAVEDGGIFDVSRLRFSPETRQQIEEFAQDFVSDDGLIGEIRAFLDTTIPYKPVWNLLSREERRKFHSNGGFIILDEKDLFCRQIARRRPDELHLLNDVLALANNENDFSVVKNPDESLTFYGAVLRDSICASEVYNECFYTSDRRISVFKIAEILAGELQKDGWIKERKKNNIYGDQRNTFIRTLDEEIDETPPTPPEPLTTSESVTVTNDNLQHAKPSDTAEQIEKEIETKSDCDDEFVTITSSADYEKYCEEEFLTDEELRELHDDE